MIQVGDTVIGRSGTYFNQEGVVMGISGSTEDPKYSVKWADNVVKCYGKSYLATSAEMTWMRGMNFSMGVRTPKKPTKKKQRRIASPVDTIPIQEIPMVMENEPVE